MGTFAVVEQEEGLARMLRGRAGVPVRPEEGPDLLIISPQADETMIPQPLRCGTVLLPGDAGRLLEKIRACSTVSYGLSGRDSITLSSRKGNRIWVSVQRELVRVDGTVLDRQEVAVRLPEDACHTGRVLAAAGALLLLGVEPNQLETG